MSDKKMKKLLLGVHNDRFNLDFLEDMSIEILDHGKDETITVFDKETVALFITLLKRDGHLKKLLEIDALRLKELGFEDKT